MSTTSARLARATDLGENIVAHRALEAAIWGMPIVSFDAMREAYFRDAGASYNDIVYWSKASDWKNQLTTLNASTLYIYFNFNLKKGPIVLELPPIEEAGLFGTLLDAWQVPLVDVGARGFDKGKGGKYLVLPPGFKGEPPAGYFVINSSTYNGYGLLRAVPESESEKDLNAAIALIKRLKVYHLAQAAYPPDQLFIDMAGRLLDGIVRYDETFFSRLARMISEEPVQARDLIMMGQLRTLGLERGKEFRPDTITLMTLRSAAQQAHQRFMQFCIDNEAWWPKSTGSYWGLPKRFVLAITSSFKFQTVDYLDIDTRAAIYFLGFAPPQKLGLSSFYLMTSYDGKGDLLQGGYLYRLRIPPNVPVQQFWSVTAYDLETASFIRESPRVGVDSFNQNLQKNLDGSIDVYFGSSPAMGRDTNWIYTAPDKKWFAIFHFYGPQIPVFEKTWKLMDIEKLGRYQ